MKSLFSSGSKAPEKTGRVSNVPDQQGGRFLVSVSAPKRSHDFYIGKERWEIKDVVSSEESAKCLRAQRKNHHPKMVTAHRINGKINKSTNCQRLVVVEDRVPVLGEDNIAKMDSSSISTLAPVTNQPRYGNPGPVLTKQNNGHTQLRHEI